MAKKQKKEIPSVCNLTGNSCRRKQERPNKDCPGCHKNMYNENGIKTASSAVASQNQFSAKSREKTCDRAPFYAL